VYIFTGDANRLPPLILKGISIGKNSIVGAGRALHNPHFCPILVIARSKATQQSRSLSLCYEIASPAMTMPGLCKGLAGSVVRRNIPDNEIWAGNPAHFIRKIKSCQQLAVKHI